MNQYKGIIFDLDGVICHTDQYHYRAWKNLADKEGIYFDEKINNRLRGVSRMDSLKIILERVSREYSTEEKEEMVRLKNSQYVDFLEEMSEKDLSKEVKDTLDFLRHKGYLLAIGSSSKNARLILKKLGLEGYFDAISDGTNIVRSKPDPEVFLKASEFIHLHPTECVVVEDALAGVDAATAGGFASAGIGEAAEHEHVTYKLTCLSDLKKYL